MRFQEFLNQIDWEIKQVKTSSEVLNAKNEARLAKQEEICMWVNGTLDELSRINPAIWYSIEDLLCQNTAQFIELPKTFKRIHKLYIGTTMYHVGTFGDSTFSYYIKDNRKIYRRDGNFTKGEIVTVEAEFIPTKLPVTSDESVLQMNVDIPEEFIELVKYSVLIRYAAKQGIESAGWIGIFKALMQQFIQYSPTVDVVGEWRNKINFGQSE